MYQHDTFSLGYRNMFAHACANKFTCNAHIYIIKYIYIYVYIYLSKKYVRRLRTAYWQFLAKKNAHTIICIELHTCFLRASTQVGQFLDLDVASRKGSSTAAWISKNKSKLDNENDGSFAIILTSGLWCWYVLKESSINTCNQHKQTIITTKRTATNTFVPASGGNTRPKKKVFHRSHSICFNHLVKHLHITHTDI